MTVRFLGEGEEDVEALRDGRIHLDVGVIGPMGPEVIVQQLFRDRFVLCVRKGHPLLRGKTTLRRLVKHGHVITSRRGKLRGPLDDALAKAGLSRRVVAVTANFCSALMIAASSDLVAGTASYVVAPLEGPMGLRRIAVPVALPPVDISHAWHPRFDADPTHRWLRQKVRAVLRERGRH